MLYLILYIVQLYKHYSTKQLLLLIEILPTSINTIIFFSCLNCLKLLVYEQINITVL